MRILISAKQNLLGIKSAKKVANELMKIQGIEEVRFDPSTAKKIKRFRSKGTNIKKFEGDIIITVGGDGTFLWTAYQANVPILPIKIEGYGFLCTTDLKTAIKNLDKLPKKEYEIIERMRLKCTKLRKGIVDRILGGKYPLCINEIAFCRKRPSKILKLNFKIDDVVFDFSGDGLMFSTPAGSTAYAASAGASVIDPFIDAINIVPLYPFNSKIKPMIVPANKTIEVTIESGDCALIIDGHSGDYFKKSKFFIEKADPIKVISLHDFKFYERFKKAFLD